MTTAENYDSRITALETDFRTELKHRCERGPQGTGDASHGDHVGCRGYRRYRLEALELE